MKTRNLIALLLTGVLFCSTTQIFAQENAASPFLGMWALTLDYEDKNAGWLEVTQKEGYLYSELLWRGGSVTPVDYTMILAGELTLINGHDVVRERDDAGEPLITQHPITWYDVSLDGADQIKGSGNFPNKDGIEVESISFTGKRIPPIGEAPKIRKIKYGEPIDLFNGKDLTGWELIGDEQE